MIRPGRRSTNVQFPGFAGDALAAALDLPADGAVQAYALFAHCFTCGKDNVAASRISDELTRHAIGVLRFDFTGLGGSEGDFANANFSSNVEDLLCAADYLRQQHTAPQLLIGHSLGGAAVLAAARDIPEVRAVATIGAPADPSHVAHLFASAHAGIERDGEAAVQIAGRTFHVRRQFLSDIAMQPQKARIRNLRLPVMVMHSPTDEIVGIGNARTIFDAARHPKSFIAIDDADHLLRRRPDTRFVGQLIASWASRYLPHT